MQEIMHKIMQKMEAVYSPQKCMNSNNEILARFTAKYMNPFLMTSI